MEGNGPAKEYGGITSVKVLAFSAMAHFLTVADNFIKYLQERKFWKWILRTSVRLLAAGRQECSYRPIMTRLPQLRLTDWRLDRWNLSVRFTVNSCGVYIGSR